MSFINKENPFAYKANAFVEET